MIPTRGCGVVMVESTLTLLGGFSCSTPSLLRDVPDIVLSDAVMHSTVLLVGMVMES